MLKYELSFALKIGPRENSKTYQIRLPFVPRVGDYIEMTTFSLQEKKPELYETVVEITHVLWFAESVDTEEVDNFRHCCALRGRFVPLLSK